MNQLKILSLNGVSRTFDYNADGRQKQGYSVPCNCEIDGAVRTAEITSFSPKMRDRIFVGAVFIHGKDTDITAEENQQYGLKIKLKAVKQEQGGQGGGSSGYQGKGNYTPKKYVTPEKFKEILVWCKQQAVELFPDHAVEAFDKILGCYTVIVDISHASTPQSTPQQPMDQSNAKPALTRDLFDAAVTLIKTKNPDVQVEGYQSLWTKVLANKPLISEDLFREIHMNFVLCAGYDPMKNVGTQHFSDDDISF
jgi:hypothetical protein